MGHTAEENAFCLVCLFCRLICLLQTVHQLFISAVAFLNICRDHSHHARHNIFLVQTDKLEPHPAVSIFALIRASHSPQLPSCSRNIWESSDSLIFSRTFPNHPVRSLAPDILSGSLHNNRPKSFYPEVSGFRGSIPCIRQTSYPHTK